MSYKNYIFLILSCSLLLSVSCSKRKQESNEKTSNVKIHNINDGKNSGKYKVDVGYSNDKDDKTAVKEIVDKLEKLSNPSMLILYASSDYKMEIVLPYLKSKYQNAVIFGASTRDEIITNEGLINGEKGSIGVLGLETTDLIVGSSAKAFKEINTKNIEVIDEAIQEAIENSKMNISTKPKLVYMSCTAKMEEKVIDRLTYYFGDEIQIYGGTASTSSVNSNYDMESFVVGNWNVYEKGVSLLLVYDGINIGGAFKSGFINFSDKKVGIITSIDNDTRTINTINDLPASDVYNGWTENIFKSEYGKGELIKNTKTQYLLTRKLGETGENVLTAVVSIDPNKKIIGTASDLKIGQQVYYIKANKDVLINRTSPMVLEALINGNIKKSEMVFGMFNICSGARRYIGERTDEVTNLLNEELIDTPWIGFVSQGEQGTIKNYGSFHGNFMSSIVMFGEN